MPEAASSLRIASQLLSLLISGLFSHHSKPGNLVTRTYFDISCFEVGVVR